MKRRLLKILRWLSVGGAIAGAAACVLLVAAYVFLQSEPGRARLVEMLNRHLSTAGATQVHVGRLEGDLPGRIELHDLSVGDGNGTWLRLKYLGASWRPAALLAGKLNISKLDADGLTVLRRPEVAADAGEFSWPELPVRIFVERFSLRNAELARPLLGDAVAFRASGDTAVEGPDRLRATIDVTRTDAVSGQARLQMLLKPRSRFVDFQLALNEADGGLLAGAMDLEDIPSLSIRIDGEGPLDALRGNARMRAGDLAFVESSFTLDATAGPALTLAGSARIARLAEPPLRKLLSGDLAFVAQAVFTDHGIELRRSSVSNDLARVELSGELSGFTADFDATATVNDLVPFGEIVGIPLHGQAGVRSRIRSDDVRRRATASVSASFTQPLPPGSPLHGLLGSDVAVAGSIAFDAAEQWAIRDLLLTADSVVLSGNGTLSADATRLDGDYQLKLTDLNALSDVLDTPLTGKLTAVGGFGGSIEHPTLTADMTSPDLTVNGTMIGPTRARVDVAQFTNGVSGEIDLSIDNHRTGAITLISQFARDAEDTLRFTGLTLESRDGKLEGAMAIDLSSATLTGELAGKGLSLAPWSELAGFALSGRASLALGMSSSGEAQQLDLTIKASDVRTVVTAQGSLDIDRVNVSARIEDVFGIPSGEMRVLATDAKTPSARFDSAVLEVKMQDPRHASGRLLSRGELHEPFELEVIAEYSAGDQGSAVIVSKLDGSLAGQAITLLKPARLERVGESILLSKSTLSVAGGRLSAGGQIGVERMDATLEVQQISLAALGAMVPMADVTGTLSGRAHVSGTRRAPLGILDLKVADVRSAESTLSVSPSLAGSLRGDWRGGRLALNATLTGVAETSIDARVSVPLRLDPVSLALAMPADEAIDGGLRWSGELGPVWDLLSPFEDRFTGPGDIALALAGTVGSPTASGHFQVARGRYENVQSGTTLTDIELRLAGNGDKLVLEKLTASDGKRGTLVGSGIIEFAPSRHYPTNLQLDFSDVLLVARDDLILNASGDLALQGTLAAGLLSGEIVIDQSELSLAGTLPPDVVELEVDEVNGEESARGRDKAPASAADPSVIVLDLDVSVPGRSFVRGLGLESEWKGDLKISGNTNAPNVAGVLSPVRGHFAVLGKRFRLEHGAIRFTGSDDIDPLLDLTAEHDAARLTALVRVTGSASKPKISITSRPPLPESEIVSQVLFGTESSKLSPAQSLQLASAIATYSGTGGAVGVLDATRRALGVDVINFAESKQDPDKTRVSVGKYVADGVYIEVERGAEEGSRVSTTLEVEVLPDVRVEGGTTETGGNQVGVKWKWDY
jgi:translocation and assembly module TamB